MSTYERDDVNSETFTDLDFVSASAIVLNTAGTQAYIADRGLGALVQVDLANGKRKIVSGPYIGKPTSVAIDGNYAFITDVEADAVIRINIATGAREMVSSSLSNPTSIALNLISQKAYVMDNSLNALFRVDLVTGSREVVSSDGVGTGPMFKNSACIALNAAKTYAFAVDVSLRTIFKIDLTTGDRTIVSSPTVGSGPAFGLANGIALLANDTQAYVTDTFTYNAGDYPTLLRVDLNTGNRAIVSSNDLGAGLHMEVPEGVAMSPDGTRAYLIDSALDVLFRIDVATGNRTVL